MEHCHSSDGVTSVWRISLQSFCFDVQPDTLQTSDNGCLIDKSGYQKLS